MRNYLSPAITKLLGMAEPHSRNSYMSISKTAALGLAAILLSAVSAQAAPHYRHHAAHHMMHAKHGMAHRGGMMRSAPMNADHSADSLNAQSLTRAQGAQ